MRKILEWIGLTALAVLLWNTYQAIYGPHALPDSIPTHFDILGNANGWGKPTMLLLPPLVTAILYLVLTVVAHYPALFNYPVAVNTSNRIRLESLAMELFAVLKLEVVYSFVFVQQAYILAARYTHGLPIALLPTIVLVFLATVVWYLVAMVRTGRRIKHHSS
jgi:uncharacterized membrane protein